MRGILEYQNGILVYIDRYRSYMIHEYENLYNEIILKRKRIDKEEAEKIKLKIEKDYREILDRYGSIFIEIKEKMIELYQIWYKIEKKDKEIQSMVKKMINQGIHEYERKHTKPTKKVRFENERK